MRVRAVLSVGMLLDRVRSNGALPPEVSGMLSSPENFQIPLFAALAISPICLLMSTTLFDKSIGKEHIFEV